MNQMNQKLSFLIRLICVTIAACYAINLLCVSSQPPGPPGRVPEICNKKGDPPPGCIVPVFEFGKPGIFVSTEGENFDAYRYINKYRRTYLLDEYVIYAKGGTKFKSHLLMYDETVNDVVTQNLGKEKYWVFVNSTGTLPSMTIFNTTFKSSIQYTAGEDNHVSYVTTYNKPFISTETSPPYDMVFELPGETRSFRLPKTVVDFQSWGLIRWQLSDNAFVTWQEMTDSVEALRQIYKDGNLLDWNLDPSNFRRVDNPCLPDIFMLYIVVGDRNNSVTQVYADIPAFHTDEKIPNFYNLTGSFCPHHREASHEECGHVEQIVLTNDNIIALTDKGLYISASLNTSDKDVNAPYFQKPLLSYQLMDPCAKFSSVISCFKQGLTSLSSELIHSVRLFYLPVCNLFQYPNYEDRIIFVVEHTSADEVEIVAKDGTKEIKQPSEPSRSVSVLYASSPYTEWKVLFIGQEWYEGHHRILGLVGIFYNYQLRHFDVTLKVLGDDHNVHEYRRFALPDREETESERMTDYEVINGRLASGFLENHFKGTFQLNEIFVHPGPMDVCFVGNQIWIAESGLSLTYTSLGGLEDDVGTSSSGETIRRCTFNHPDRSFACVNQDNKILIVGRVGASYSPIIANVEDIKAIQNAASPHGSYWTLDYMKEAVIPNAYFTASFSGKILLWYLFNEDELKKYQKALFDKLKPANEVDDIKKCQEYSNIDAYVKSCIKIMKKERDDPSPTPKKPSERGAYFRMIAINPHTTQPVEEPTAGPLAPFFVDAMTAILYEARLPGDDMEYIYFSNVFIGREIDCYHYELKTDFLNPVTKTPNCKLFVRHIKPVDKFLGGFRQIMYATIIKSIPMLPVDSSVTVLYPYYGGKRENIVLVMMHSFKYTKGHIGQTHYFPGNFSVLLQGFPDQKKDQLMWGYSTRQYRQDETFTMEPLTTYIIDMSTHAYRDKRLETVPSSKETFDQKEWNDFLEKYKVEITGKDIPADPINIINKAAGNPNPGKVLQTYAKTIRKEGDKPEHSWVTTDGSCNLLLQLKRNNVLFSHGGRISLDLHDAISFTIVLRPTTELGRLLLYRPLFVLTNSNPRILQVENEKVRSEGTQTQNIMLSPTGAGMGVASFSVRSVITSMKCATPTSITFIVQVHRAEGRRLHINYPIPICAIPPNKGGYIRPWKKDVPSCTPYQQIIQAGKDASHLKRASTTIYTYLPKNYRPPSIRGEQIPLSPYTYNAEPKGQKWYNNWYHITNDTRKLRKCSFRKTREDCKCSDADLLSDHPDSTDCKQLVFTVPRAKSFNISIEYDPIMQDKDQHKNFFSAKDHLSVYIEEINKRREFTIISMDIPQVLKNISQIKILNEGKKFYNAHNLTITLHGTGLFHFKAGLGRFDSFEEVTGYFVVYSDSNELNHVKLIVVMLLTITFCFSLIFFGFIRVRRRLSSQLPFQSRAKSKFKLE